MEHATHPLSVDDHQLVAKAARRAAGELGLTLTELGAVVGVSRARFSRPNARLDGKQMELGLHLVRIARSLSAMTSGDSGNMQHWLRTKNRDLGECPVEMLTSVEGLIRVGQYLDTMRAKI